MATTKTPRTSHNRHRVKLPHLHDNQEHVRRSKARFKVLAAGRRFGKTRLCVVLALALAMLGGAVWWVAPTVDLTKRGWRPTLQLARRLPGCRINLTEKRIEFSSGGFIEFKTAGTEVSLRGEGLDLIIIEEAAFLEETRWTQELRPSLADRKGAAIFISTPNGFNWFHGLFERGKSPAFPEWESWLFTSYDNPYIDPAEIEASAEDMSDEEFAQEHMARFLEAGGVPAFKRDWFTGPRVRFDPQDERLSRLALARFAALDTANTAKANSAYTALVVGELRRDYSVAIRYVSPVRVEFPALRDWLMEELSPWAADGKLTELYIENRASGVQLIQDIDYSGPQWLRSITVPVDVSPLKGGQEIDWRDAAPWCRRSMVALPFPHDSVPWLRPFEKELFAVPQTPFWDQATAFSHLINNIQRREEAPLSTGWHYREAKRMQAEEANAYGQARA